MANDTGGLADPDSLMDQLSGYLSGPLDPLDDTFASVGLPEGIKMVPGSQLSNAAPTMSSEGQAYIEGHLDE